MPISNSGILFAQIVASAPAEVDVPRWVREMDLCESLKSEVSGAKFGDRRLEDRLERVSASAMAAPSESFPEMTTGHAELEAMYRFLSNERVNLESILAPHFQATIERARAAETIIVAHDTSEFSFGSLQRQDLDRVGQGKSFGFNLHLALAVLPGEERVPLGVLAANPFKRPFGSPRLSKGKNKHKPENTMKRWEAQVRQVRELVGDAASMIHVMDREADDYTLLAAMTEMGDRFVVRQAHARRTKKYSTKKVNESVTPATILAAREIALTTRRPAAKKAHGKSHPMRKARRAELIITAAAVTVERPESAGGFGPRCLSLNLVHVHEPNPPAECEPISWWLWTTEPIATEKDVLAIVDAYRNRWVIEEYFKSLKTGCAIEQRQLETRHSLLNALAVFIPVAWRLLLLRNLARNTSDAPADLALTPMQIEALRALVKKRYGRELSTSLTVSEALMAIAKIGGHILANGDPGWIVLHRGFDTLLAVECGFALARSANGAEEYSAAGRAE